MIGIVKFVGQAAPYCLCRDLHRHPDSCLQPFVVCINLNVFALNYIFKLYKIFKVNSAQLDGLIFLKYFFPFVFRKVTINANTSYALS